MVEVTVWIGKFSVVSEGFEFLPELANRSRGRVAFLCKSLLGESDVASPTLFGGVIEAGSSDAVRLPAVRENTHGVRPSELVGSAFNAGRGADSTRESWDVVLGERWRRCEFEILIQALVVLFELIGIDASDFTNLFERAWQAFKATSSVYTGGRHSFDRVAGEHSLLTDLTVKVSSAIMDGSGEFKRTDEASDFTETETERAFAGRTGFRSVIPLTKASETSFGLTR